MESADQTETPLHIIELRAENVKRLRAVTVRPDGAVVIIGGRNAQGKSSLLDAIEMALGGGRSIPLEPVRHGARKARIFLDLGEIVVERTISAKGSEIVVRGRDGLERASPQKLLDGLCAKVTFDPQAFARQEPAKQDEILKKLLGLDFSDIEAARKKLYDQRTDSNREVKRLEALLDGKPEQLRVPEPIDVAEVSAELDRRVDANADRKAALERIATARRDLATADSDLEEMRTRLADLRKQVTDSEREIAEAETERETTLAMILKSEQAVPAELDLTELREKRSKAEAVNAQVREAAERRKLEQDLKKHEAAAAGYTDTIASLDEEKAERLAAAKFPIEGLGFDDIGPTLNGVPLAQASGAEKLRVSVAIGAALNPRVKVMLVRDGSLLDEESMRLLEQLAKETGSQVWIERVGTKDPSAIVIEDGAVLEGSGEKAAE